MCSTETPSSFYRDEMLRSLTEQSFGLEASTILETTQLQATALVTLLEGQKIKIKLTMRGYSIESSDDPAIPIDEDAIFESSDDLLRSVSLKYEEMKHEALVKKLEKLA